MESFISGYVHAQGQRCSGRELGHETSLQSAQAKCDTNEDCACIDDADCDGGYWKMHAGQSTAKNKKDCSWTKPGSLI